MLLNPKRGVREYPDEASRELMLAVIDFFESMGLARIKHDDHERIWYADFLEFVKDSRLFSLVSHTSRLRRRRMSLGHLAQLRAQRDSRILRPGLLVHLAGDDPRARADLDERQRGGQTEDRRLTEGGRHLRLWTFREEARCRPLLERNDTLSARETGPFWREGRNTTSATPTKRRWSRCLAEWPTPMAPLQATPSSTITSTSWWILAMRSTNV